MERRWSKIDRLGLARFVPSDAGLLVRLSPAINPHDLLTRGDFQGLARGIYEALVGKGIRYGNEKFDTSDETQLIRTPEEILQGQGTCLDLALLFCGLCLYYDLLPLPIVLEGHALAAFSLRHRLSQFQSLDRRELELFRETGTVIDKKPLRDLIASGAYDAIECTGFARSHSLANSHPEGVGRDADGLLSFERAIAAGAEQLRRDDRPLLFALDVALARRFGIEPQDDVVQGVQPLLSRPPGARARDRDWFYGYGVDFVGREHELDELRDFLRSPIILDGEPDFSWWLWTAAGGQGKTRLAAKFCLEAESKGWHCGFLSTASEFEDWDKWVIERPTLIVVDHLAARPEKIRNAICTLTRHPTNIKKPLRFLLLERPFGRRDSWVEVFAPAADLQDRRDLFEHAYTRTGLGSDDELSAYCRTLGSFESEDVWKIVQTVAAVRGISPPERDIIIPLLEKIDSLFRPLFLILTMDAVASKGLNQLRQWNRRDLMTFVLKKEFALWQETLNLSARTAGSDARKRFDEHLSVIAFTTVVGRESSRICEFLKSEGLAVPDRLLPGWLRVINGYSSQGEVEDPRPSDTRIFDDVIIGPLEPDILGELFILERWAGEFGVDSSPESQRRWTQRTLEIALAHRGHPTVDFLKRCADDFPEHGSLLRLPDLGIPEGDDANYGYFVDYSVVFGRIANLMSKSGHVDIAAKCYDRLIQLARRHLDRLEGNPLEIDCRIRIAAGLYNRAIDESRHSAADVAILDCDEIVSVVDKPALRETADSWSQAQLAELVSNALLLRARLRSENDPSTARADIERVLKESDEDDNIRAEALLLRIALNLECSDDESAIKDCEAILALHVITDEREADWVEPKRFGCKLLWDKAVHVSLTGDKQRALALFEGLLKLASSFPDLRAMVRVNRSALRLDKGDWSGAIEDCSAILEDPESPIEQRLKALTNRSQVLWKQGLIDLAMSDIELVLGAERLNSHTRGIALFVRAQLQHHVGQTVSAMGDLTALIDDPTVDPGVRDKAKTLQKAWCK